MQKILAFNIKPQGVQIFDESWRFGLFQLITLILFQVSNLQSYYYELYIRIWQNINELDASTIDS